MLSTEPQSYTSTVIGLLCLPNVLDLSCTPAVVSSCLNCHDCLAPVRQRRTGPRYASASWLLRERPVLAAARTSGERLPVQSRPVHLLLGNPWSSESSHELSKLSQGKHPRAVSAGHGPITGPEGNALRLCSRYCDRLCRRCTRRVPIIGFGGLAVLVCWVVVLGVVGPVGGFGVGVLGRWWRWSGSLGAASRFFGVLGGVGGPAGGGVGESEVGEAS